MGSSSVYFYRPACFLEATGSDTQQFLQGQFSNDLGKATRGDCVYGLWLNRKGKIVADSFALCDGAESFRLVSYYCSETVVRERLDHYLVMDEVELFGKASSSYGVAVWGDAISATVEALGISVPEKKSWSANESVSVFWGSRGNEEVLEIVFSGADAAGEIERVREVAISNSYDLLSSEDLDRMAVVDLKPRVGLEIGSSDLPQEVELVDSAVSFNKGCYLGQEVMARIHSMGKARKGLVSIVCESDLENVDFPVNLLDSDARKRGSLRAVAKCSDGYVGIAIVSLASEGVFCIEDSNSKVSVKRD